MSEIQLKSFTHPIGNAAWVGYVPPQTPVFYFSDAGTTTEDLNNIRYLKSALGFLEEERKISQIIEWMTANGKNTAYMALKKTELENTNKKLCKFILSYMNTILWKKTPAGGAYPEVPDADALVVAELTTYSVHEAMQQIIPAFKGVAQLMATMLEYKYPSNLIGASLQSAIKQVNLEVKEKTEDIVKSTKKSKKQK